MIVKNHKCLQRTAEKNVNSIKIARKKQGISQRIMEKMGIWPNNRRLLKLHSLAKFKSECAMLSRHASFCIFVFFILIFVLFWQ